MFEDRWRPRVEGHSASATRFRTARRISIALAIIGAAVLAFSLWKGYSDAVSPHVPLPRIPFAKLVDPAERLPDAARVLGVVPTGQRSGPTTTECVRTRIMTCTSR